MNTTPQGRKRNTATLSTAYFMVFMATITSSAATKLMMHTTNPDAASIKPKIEYTIVEHQLVKTNYLPIPVCASLPIKKKDHKKTAKSLDMLSAAIPASALNIR